MPNGSSETKKIHKEKKKQLAHNAYEHMDNK